MDSQEDRYFEDYIVGRVHTKIEVFNQHGAPVMTLKAVNIVASRNK